MQNLDADKSTGLPIAEGSDWQHNVQLCVAACACQTESLTCKHTWQVLPVKCEGRITLLKTVAPGRGIHTLCPGLSCTGCALDCGSLPGVAAACSLSALLTLGRACELSLARGGRAADACGDRGPASAPIPQVASALTAVTVGQLGEFLPFPPLPPPPLSFDFLARCIQAAQVLAQLCVHSVRRPLTR